MENKLTKFFQKNKRTLGIIGLIILAIAFFIQKSEINIPIVSGSVLGTFGGVGISLGILLIITGIVLIFATGGAAFTFVIPVIGAGLLLVKGGFITIWADALIKNPLVLIVGGIILAFFIFRKRK